MKHYDDDDDWVAVLLLLFFVTLLFSLALNFLLIGELSMRI
ncbi:MAG: hypothetical protein JG772_894 [Dysgonamonadaceae bacterium]|jgi:hypothetical protein|nr:hypothetical protein [Dysgonamonadaceae bacterium]